MKPYHLFLLTALILIITGTGISQDNNALLEKYRQEIIDAEKAFSKMSVEKGMAEAFLFYAAENVIKLKDKQFPNMDKEDLRKDFEGFDAATAPKLSWEPVRADVAESGDLGYTFGKWVIEGKDENGAAKKGYGVYVTIWKRQNDGTWKFVLDGGNSTPPPAN